MGAGVPKEGTVQRVDAAKPNNNGPKPTTSSHLAVDSRYGFFKFWYSRHYQRFIWYAIVTFNDASIRTYFSYVSEFIPFAGSK